jgi:hypothetical protein
VSHAPTLGLHEGSVGLQLIIFSVDEMLVGIVGEFFGTTLEGRHDGIILNLH